MCEILSLHALSLSDTIFIFFQTNIQKHQKYHWGFLDKCWCNNYSKHVHISHTSILQPAIFRIKIFNFESGILWCISYTVLFKMMGAVPGHFLKLKYRFAIFTLINVLVDSVITNDINATFNAASFHFFVCM